MNKDLQEYLKEQVRKAYENNDIKEFERLFKLLKNEENAYMIFFTILKEDNRLIAKVKKQPVELYITEIMKLEGEKRDSSRLYSKIFKEYNEYCKNNKYEPVSAKFFTNVLRQYCYTTKRFGKKNITYIVDVN